MCVLMFMSASVVRSVGRCVGGCVRVSFSADTLAWVLMGVNTKLAHMVMRQADAGLSRQP